MKINILWEEESKREINRTSLFKNGGKEGIRKEVRRISASLKIKGKELNIIFCSARYIKQLARQYLKKDYIPACLTFPFDNVFLGEIYINYESLRDFPLPFLLRHSLRQIKSGEAKNLRLSL